ncbi:MAG TPA: rRNA maturation RNase YbeY [bacterium]|nr:rRNA maturation RNase YbeY [bacterium]
MPARSRPGAAAGVEVVFLDDRSIAALARRFRGSPRATDVLAFCYGCALPSGTGEAGGIAVSVDTAARQAGERGVPLTCELILLCVHGLLHLAGLGDESPGCWLRMRRAEFETMMRIL